MRIVAANLQHDGAIAIVRDGQLARYIEAQKDNHRRYASLGVLTLSRVWNGIGEQLGGPPDIVGIAGWQNSVAPYRGCGTNSIVTGFIDSDATMRQFATSHERAHILCAYALSPFEQGEPCYALVYEGNIGAFYSIDHECNITPLIEPVREPGHRYAALYELADRTFAADSQGMSAGTAGKLMALAGTREEVPLEPAERQLMAMLIDGVFQEEGRWGSVVPQKHRLQASRYWNAGHLDARFRQFARRFSDTLFDRFYGAVVSTVTAKLPLLIAGGCGLNCSWNTRWRNSGLFREIFIPPCPDDSGIAIGVAADAQRHYGGKAKLEWDVYSGEAFQHDVIVAEEFQHTELDYDHVAGRLREGAVVAWVQGRYEIGPRALGNRSLLGAPFDKAMAHRLNQIKEREGYRPIAPVCLEEEVSKWFDWQGESRYMLHFQNVRSTGLAAVTHDDGSARVQTVNERQNGRLYKLLRAFAVKSGMGVLCNTSLNFPGHGFINRTSDLVAFVRRARIEIMVIGDDVYQRREG